ncbi:MAG: GlsB/YeaQ/YmgE family stress response membrane protein [Candidatus Amulumruptor caecigallinarius]|nr:GlsB/YeaQ/YmgE family stress response membrane protein [Candidatus Amulumruptor caecigallinarius]
MSFIWFIIIGILSGLIAGKLMRGGGFGWIVNLLVGIVGGVLGGWVFGLFGIHTSSIIGSLITSVVGAVIFLWILGLISRSAHRV